MKLIAAVVIVGVVGMNVGPVAAQQQPIFRSVNDKVPGCSRPESITQAQWNAMGASEQSAACLAVQSVQRVQPSQAQPPECVGQFQEKRSVALEVFGYLVMAGGGTQIIAAAPPSMPDSICGPTAPGLGPFKADICSPGWSGRWLAFGATSLVAGGMMAAYGRQVVVRRVAISPMRKGFVATTTVKW